MKYTLLIYLSFIFTVPNAFANTTPEVLISNEFVHVTAIGSLEIFSKSEFNFEKDILEFTTHKIISSIHIFGYNDFLEFQLPVRSHKVKVDKNLFGKGKYKLAFILEGESKIHLTTVTIK